jgi:hypothetical protein
MAEPICGSMDLILDGRKTFCARRPHRHRDHDDNGGHTWPSYEGEYDDMLKVTTSDLRALLDGTSERPVLYVARDEDTGEPVSLEVWAEALVPHGDIIARRHELVDALGGPDHPDGVTEDALENLLEGYQDEVDAIEERSAVPDDACVDADDEVHPEHDYPPVDQGNECRRCGAEAEEK